LERKRGHRFSGGALQDCPQLCLERPTILAGALFQSLYDRLVEITDEDLGHEEVLLWFPDTPQTSSSCYHYDSTKQGSASNRAISARAQLPHASIRSTNSIVLTASAK